MSLVPYVIEQTNHGERSYDIYSRLLKDRIIFVGTAIDETVANSLFGSSAEAEGIQLKGDYVYFGISDKSKSDRACIYSIPKSVF